MKNIGRLLLGALLVSGLGSNAQITELNEFCNSLFKALGEKNTEALQGMVARKADLAVFQEEFELDEEELNDYENEEVPEMDIFADPGTFYEDLEDEVFDNDGDEEVMKNLDLKNFEVLFTFFDSDISVAKNGIVEVEAQVFLKSGGQVYNYTIGELIYVNGTGYKFYGDPDISLESDEICVDGTDCYATKSFHADESKKYVSALFKKDKTVLDAYKKIENKQKSEGKIKKPYIAPVEDVISGFWEELEELGVADGSIPTFISSFGARSYFEGREGFEGMNDAVEIISCVEVDGKYVFIELEATYKDDGGINFDGVEATLACPKF